MERLKITQDAFQEVLDKVFSFQARRRAIMARPMVRIEVLTRVCDMARAVEYLEVKARTSLATVPSEDFFQVDTKFKPMLVELDALLTELGRYERERWWTKPRVVFAAMVAALRGIFALKGL